MTFQQHLDAREIATNNLIKLIRADAFGLDRHDGTDESRRRAGQRLATDLVQLEDAIAAERRMRKHAAGD